MNRKIKLIFILYCLRFTLTLHPYFSISIYNIERMRMEDETNREENKS